MKWRKWFAIIAAVLALVFASVWALLHPHSHDPYAFLAERSPVRVGVIGPGSFGPKEMRVYMWQHPWQEVASSARAELLKLGWKKEHHKKGGDPGVMWLGGEITSTGLEGTDADEEILIMPGQNHELRQSGMPSDGDPKWVTVTVQSSLDESWINVVRYTCFPMPE